MSELLKNKKMLRNLLILVVVLIVLILAVVLVKQLPQNQNGEIIPSKQDYALIYSCEYNDINYIECENINGSYVFVKNDEGWLCQSNPDVIIGEYEVLALIADFGTFSGSIIEENPEDLSIYGLDNPSSTLSIKLSDGTGETFILGNSTATDSGYYLKTMESEAVYLIPTYKGVSLLKGLFDFRNTKVFEVEADDCHKVIVENKNGYYIITKTDQNIESGTTFLMANWQVVSRDILQGNDQLIEEAFFKEMELETTEFIDNDPSAYAKYGLTDPTARLTYEYFDDTKNVLTFGKMSDGEIYLLIDDAPYIYKVSAKNLSALSLSNLDVVADTTMLENIENIDSVTIDVDDTIYTMEIDRTGDKPVYKFNGEAVKEADFKDLYLKIISITIDGEISTQGSGYFMASVTFDYVEDIPPKTIQYFTYEDRYASIIIDGNLNYYTARQKVQNIIDGIKDFAK